MLLGTNCPCKWTKPRTKKKPSKQAGTSLSPFLIFQRRLSIPENPRQVRQTIYKQESRNRDIPPSQQIPPCDIEGRLSPHGKVRHVDVSKVRDGKTEQVVAQNLGLSGGVANSHAEEKKEAVEIGELVG